MAKKKSFKDFPQKSSNLSKIFERINKEKKKPIAEFNKNLKNDPLIEKENSLEDFLKSSNSLKEEETILILTLFLPFKIKILENNEEEIGKKINVEILFCQETQSSYYIYNSSIEKQNYTFVGFICFEKEEEELFFIKEKNTLEKYFLENYSIFPIFISKNQAKFVLGFTDLLRNIGFIFKKEYNNCEYLKKIWEDLKKINLIYCNNFLRKFTNVIDKALILITDICLVLALESIFKVNESCMIALNINFPLPYFENLKKLPFFENLLENLILPSLIIFQDYEILRFIIFIKNLNNFA